MKQVWKYPIEPSTPLIISMPEGAEVIRVDVQPQRGYDVPCMWAVVDITAPLKDREFWVLGTGHPFPLDLTLVHLGSFSLEGPLEFHVFEAFGAAT